MPKSLWIYVVLLGAIGAPGAAKASSICVIPNSTVLNVLPAGCEATLTNGPIFFTGVVDSGGDIHNVEVDTVNVFGLNNGANSLDVYAQGTDTDVTAGTVTNFSNLSTTTFFQTIPLNNTYSPDTGTQTFGIAHLIDSLPGGLFKLNFGESGAPTESADDFVTGSAVSSGGSYNVSGFFDIFTELSLNCVSTTCINFQVAGDDFTGNDNTVGPGAQFSLINETPEPATSLLFAAGLVGLGLARRGKKR